MREQGPTVPKTRVGATPNGTRYDTGEEVVVNVGGYGASCVGGTFWGENREVRESIAEALEYGCTVRVLGVPLVASAETPLGWLAALAYHSPGRVVITHAPQSVWDHFERARAGREQFIAQGVDA